MEGLRWVSAGVRKLLSIRGQGLYEAFGVSFFSEGGEGLTRLHTVITGFIVFGICSIGSPLCSLRANTDARVDLLVLKGVRVAAMDPYTLQARPWSILRPDP